MITDFNFKIQDNNNAKKLQLAFNLKKVRFEYDYNNDESIFSFKDAKSCDKAKWYAEVLIDKTKEPNWSLTK